MRRAMLFVLLLAMSLAVTACGGEEDRGPSDEGTKAGVIALLRRLESSVRSGDLDGALPLLVERKDKTPEQRKTSLLRLMKIEGVTPKAISRLEAKGRFGALQKLWPTKGPAWAKRAGVPIGECLGLRAGSAEVGVHWDGWQLRFMRINNLQTLR